MLYKTTILHQLAGLSLNRIPDEPPFLAFVARWRIRGSPRHPGRNRCLYLGDRSLSLRQGAHIDATLINAPSSTKNKDGKRDLEMHQTKKGNHSAAHIGVDDVSGLAFDKGTYRL